MVLLTDLGGSRARGEKPVLESPRSDRSLHAHSCHKKGRLPTTSSHTRSPYGRTMKLSLKYFPAYQAASDRHRRIIRQACLSEAFGFKFRIFLQLMALSRGKPAPTGSVTCFAHRSCDGPVGAGLPRERAGTGDPKRSGHLSPIIIRPMRLVGPRRGQRRQAIGRACIVAARVAHPALPRRIELPARARAVGVDGTRHLFADLAGKADAAARLGIGADHRDPCRVDLHHQVVRHNAPGRLAFAPEEGHTEVPAAGAAVKARVIFGHEATEGRLLLSGLGPRRHFHSNRGRLDRGGMQKKLPLIRLTPRPRITGEQHSGCPPARPNAGPCKCWHPSAAGQGLREGHNGRCAPG